jgi:uncharacterized glyoxalase superfamily protein PhnB
MTRIKRLSPILTVEAIEPSLTFWVDRLGFKKTVEVPGEGGLGFVALEREGVEVMLQTKSSILADLPALAAEAGRGPTLLYLDVRDLDRVELLFEDLVPVVPRRKTFYGATEITFREPGGHLVTFAEFENP